MLQLHPHQRLSMADLIGHPWMQGPIASAEEVRAEFEQRHNILKQDQKQQAEMKAEVRNQHRTKRQGTKRGETIKGKVYMSGPVTEAELERGEEEEVVMLQLENYDPIVSNFTNFFTTYEPEFVLKSILD